MIDAAEGDVTATMEHTAADLLPDGSRLLHIGPPKTGTTALQGAFHRSRTALLAQGVRYAGRARHSRKAVFAAVDQPWRDGGGPPPRRLWRDLRDEVRGAAEPRVVISSEAFSFARPDAIRRIVDELDPARVRVAVTLRPITRILPSHWQQVTQAGSRVAYTAWLEATLDQAKDAQAEAFWFRQRHDELIARWAEVVGLERVTVIALDDHDRSMMHRAFERLLGLREGTLVPREDLLNRSLTLPEVEAVRAFNVAFKAEGLGRALHGELMLRGAAQAMKRRRPAPDEPRIETPQWALDRATEIAREMVANIAASGVRVVGDLAPLAAPQQSRLPADGPPEVAIPPEVAAAMAMGILVASGAARSASGGPSGTEPIELARVPTYQVAGVIGLRARAAVVTRLRRLRRRWGR